MVFYCSFYVVFIIITVLMVILSYLTNSRRKDLVRYWFGNIMRGLFATFIVSTLISAMILISSYFSYLRAVECYNTIMQYEEAVEMYSDHINLNLRALTDFTYLGHPDSLTDLIKDLRHQVVTYNSIISAKRALQHSIFKGLIIQPEEYMKIMKMRNKGRC